jgi:hypothetical protein
MGGERARPARKSRAVLDENRGDEKGARSPPRTLSRARDVGRARSRFVRGPIRAVGLRAGRAHYSAFRRRASWRRPRVRGRHVVSLAPESRRPSKSEIATIRDSNARQGRFATVSLAPIHRDRRRSLASPARLPGRCPRAQIRSRSSKRRRPSSRRSRILRPFPGSR